MEILLAVLCGYLLDLLFGDPHWLPHPVQLMGWCISKGEKLLRSVFPKTPSRIVGRIGAGSLYVLLGFFVPLGILYAAGLIHPAVRFGLEVLFATRFRQPKVCGQRVCECIFR